MDHFLLQNRCTRTRAKTLDNHTLKVFSVFYQHPSLLDPDAWKLFDTGDENILIDEDTMVILHQHICEFGYQPKTGTILTCKITPKETKDLKAHWDKILDFCNEVKKDFSEFWDETTLKMENLSLKSDPLQEHSGSTSNGPTLESIPEETVQTLPSKLDEDLD